MAIGDGQGGLASCSSWGCKELDMTVKLNLEGVDSNAFVLLGHAMRAMRQNHKMELWDEFHKEATAGDYNHLLATLSDWFDICFGDEDEEDEYDEEED